MGARGGGGVSYSEDDANDEVAQGAGESSAPQRTSLAWGRTNLALLASGAAILKGLPSITGNGARPLPGVIIVVLAVIAWSVNIWTDRGRERAIRGGEMAIEGPWLGRIATTTVLIGLVGLVVATFG